LYATTDWRSLCSPISSIPAVRQLPAGKSGLATRSSSGSTRGEERWKTLRATDARGERASCAEQRTGEATYARGRKCENALELRGRAPADSPDQTMNGALRAAGAREVGLCPEDEHTGKRRRRYGRAGVHTENAWTQTRRQRFGVAGRKKSERARSTGTYLSGCILCTRKCAAWAKRSGCIFYIRTTTSVAAARHVRARERERE